MGLMRLMGLMMVLGLAQGWAAPGQVKCSWDANTETNVSGYRVLWGLASQRYTSTNTVLGRLNNSVTVALPVGVSYLVVQAFDNVEDGPFSYEIVWTNAPPPPLPPKNFKVTAVIQASVAPGVGPWRDLAQVTVALPPGGEKQSYRTRMSVEEVP